MDNPRMLTTATLERWNRLAVQGGNDFLEQVDSVALLSHIYAMENHHDRVIESLATSHQLALDQYKAKLEELTALANQLGQERDAAIKRAEEAEAALDDAQAETERAERRAAEMEGNLSGMRSHLEETERRLQEAMDKGWSLTP